MIPIRRAAIKMKVCSSIQDIHTFDECAHAWIRPLGDCAVHHQHHPIIQHTISEFLLDQRDSALLCWCWLEPDSDCGAAEHAPWSHQGRHLGGRPSSSYEYEVQKYLSRRENIDIILHFCQATGTGTGPGPGPGIGDWGLGWGWGIWNGKREWENGNGKMGMEIESTPIPSPRR